MQARDWLSFTKRFIPAHEAEQILEQTLGISPAEQRLTRDRELAGDQLELLTSRMRRRALGEPLQYILGDAPFFGRYFKVTPDVLIPRPETEILVNEVLSWAKGRTLRGAELGLGSGCISLSLLLEIPKLKMIASEVSTGALQVAHQNAELHGIRLERLELLKSLGEQFEIFLPHGPFDFIVSNPPYLTFSDELGRGVSAYEPELALFSREDLNSFYRNAAKNLRSLVILKGAGFFEIPHNRASEISDIFVNFGFETHLCMDLTGRPRVLKVCYQP